MKVSENERELQRMKIKSSERERENKRKTNRKRNRERKMRAKFLKMTKKFKETDSKIKRQRRKRQRVNYSEERDRERDIQWEKWQGLKQIRRCDLVVNPSKKMRLYANNYFQLSGSVNLYLEFWVEILSWDFVTVIYWISVISEVTLSFAY